GGYIYLAFIDGKVVGSIGLERINDKEYALTKMGVKPNYQGKKIGSFLMEKALQKARELNLNSFVLYTNQELIGALNLYIKYGFRFVKLDYTSFKRATIKMQLTF
ncbi:GNAT family N-acetyltransferase, partial [Zobellia sp.]|nr:GNAT family N-acetyltransferase [Zobellia sp.]